MGQLIMVLERPKCRCFKEHNDSGDQFVDTVGQQLMSQLYDQVSEYSCDEAMPYILSNWTVGVAMLWGLYREAAQRPDDRPDIALIRKYTQEILALLPAAMEQRLALLEKSQQTGKDN